MTNAPHSRFYHLLTLGCATIVFAAGGTCAAAAEEPVRTPEQIIEAAGGEITPEVAIELFTNCTVDDAAHKDVKVPSREKLIELGPKALPTLLKEYLPSEALYHRIEIINVVKAIGHPAAPYLIPYLKHERAHGRRYAAHLLGETAAAAKLEDPYALGPLPGDVPAIEALEAALEDEGEWQVLASIVGAIGAMRDPGKVDLIASYLTHQEQWVRLGAAIGLGKIPHRLAMLRLLSAFEDEEATVRQAAMLQLCTTTNGDLAFDLLVEVSGSQNVPERKRLCALESLARYFDAVMADKSLKTESSRKRQQKTAFKLAKRLLSEKSGEGWNIRGHAVKLMASSEHPKAGKFIRKHSKTERHPFVLTKIDLALNRLD